MSNNKKHNNRKVRRDRRVRIRSIRRNPPDLRKLAAAVIQLAEAQAEADAEAEHACKQANRRRHAERQADSDEQAEADRQPGGRS